jgi:hypothetical protein
MAKASRIAASQAQSLADVRLLVMALCEKSGLNVDEVLGVSEPQTRDEMKAYAKATPTEAAPTPPAQVPKGRTKLPSPKSEE